MDEPAGRTELEFSDAARSLFTEGAGEANRLGHERFGAHHLLLAVLGMPQGAASAALDASGVDRAAARAAVERDFPQGDAPPGRQEMPYDRSAMEALQQAMTDGRSSGRGRISTGHLLLALLRSGDPPVHRALEEAGADIPLLTTRLEAAPDDA